MKSENVRTFSFALKNSLDVPVEYLIQLENYDPYAKIAKRRITSRLISFQFENGEIFKNSARQSEVYGFFYRRDITR